MCPKPVVTGTNNCPSCEKYRWMQQNYCRVCGHDLAEKYADYVPIKYPYLKGEDFCGKCGAQMNADRTCPKCGW